MTGSERAKEPRLLNGSPVRMRPARENGKPVTPRAVTAYAPGRVVVGDPLAVARPDDDLARVGADELRPQVKARSRQWPVGQEKVPADGIEFIEALNQPVQSSPELCLGKGRALGRDALAVGATG
jgi:hypothetical protein